MLIIILMTMPTLTNYHTAAKKSACIGIIAQFIYEGIVFCMSQSSPSIKIQ